MNHNHIAEDERQAAETLDENLNRLLDGQPAKLESAAGRTAEALHRLGRSNPPDPVFRAALAGRLQHAAQLRRGGNRRTLNNPFLSLATIRQAGGRLMNLKNAFLFTSAAALVILLAVILLRQTPPPVALLPTASATPGATPASTQEVTPTSHPTEPPAPQPPSPTPLTLPSAAPSLPTLATWLGGGFGGGGGGRLPYTFELAAELPSGAQTAGAYLLRQPEGLDPLQLRELAARLGLSDPAFYTIGESAGLIAIQGQKEIVFGGPLDFNYLDRAVFNFPGGRYYYPDELAPGSEIVAAAATAFLEQARLLEAPYSVEVNGEYARFYHLLSGGGRVDGPFAVVAVGADGTVGSAQLHSQAVDAIGSYDLISAAEAWALVGDANASERIYVWVQPAVDGNPPLWVRSYQPGEAVQVIAPLVLYGDGPAYIRINGLEVRATPEQLQALADAYRVVQQSTMDSQAPISLWGVTGADGWTLELQGFGEASQPVLWNGTLSRDGPAGSLTTADGQTLTLPGLPDDLPGGKQVFVEGGLVNGQLEWTLIQEAPQDMPPPGTSQLVTLDSVERGYLAPDAMQLAQQGASDVALRTLQPVWRFSGRTALGDLVTVYVQAVR